MTDLRVPGTPLVSLRGSPRSKRAVGAWPALLARRLLATDTLIVTSVVAGAQLLQSYIRGDASVPGVTLDAAHTAVSVLVIAAWLVAMKRYGTRDPRVVGVGNGEYRRILTASLGVFGLFAMAAVLLGTEIGRGYVLVALPVGALLLIASRGLWRRWLHGRRRGGAFSHRVLVVGSVATVAHTVGVLRRHGEAGYRVVAACVPDSDRATEADTLGVPVAGDVHQVLAVLRQVEADTVILAGADAVSPEDIRRLGWELEEGRYSLVMAPSLTDVSGPRLHTQPVAGLPLIHVDIPTFDGVQRVSKRLFDLVGAVLLLTVLAPVFAFVAIAVKVSSAGPVMFRHERIGRNGSTFAMLKFRSMRQGADAELAALLRAQGRDGQPLFKVDDDPRITAIGRVIRKYSIDELPQLINVLRGQMSLVGPRPQVAGEVALYDDAAQRRLYVQPGMTGLWQVSGRSRLSWDEAIRLDLSYVENWSLIGDVGIMLRTIRAVVRPGVDAR